MLARLRLIATNLLIGAVLALVAIEAIPQSPVAVRSAVRPLTVPLGLNQSWNLFTPPDQVNTRMRAEITYADGRTATWHSPDWPQFSAAQRVAMHRRSEWLDSIWNVGDSPAMTSWARFLARDERPDLPGADRNAEVKIILDEAPIPAAEIRPWKSWRAAPDFDQSTTLFYEKLP